MGEKLRLRVVVRESEKIAGTPMRMNCITDADPGKRQDADVDELEIVEITCLNWELSLFFLFCK